ncbi:ABC transporter ATP-binding protein [Beggiatoa alba]|nr:ABC transporter ATP-binding protein [Beggiatoa alba]
MSEVKHLGGVNLSINHLNFSYKGNLQIFNDLNIEVEPGEFLAILGPSGCGKTTLLNLLAGFYQPDSGTAQLSDKAISPEDPILGYIFQSANLFPWLSTIENVEFGLRMSGMPASESREVALNNLEMVGLKGFEDFLPNKLSGGMQQRASIARALCLQPHLLLMDEPFSALDEILRDKMNDELLQLWDKLGQTIVFITHSIEEATYLSDRVLVLARPPGGIYKELKNELPRPRDLKKTKSSDLFWEYKKELNLLIQEVQTQAPLDESEMAELELNVNAG